MSKWRKAKVVELEKGRPSCRNKERTIGKAMERIKTTRKAVTLACHNQRQPIEGLHGQEEADYKSYN